MDATTAANRIAKKLPGQPVLVSCQKDEGPFLVEFLAHHLALGFTAVLVASNDCTDGSDALLDALQEAGYCGHIRHHAAEGDSPQIKGFAALMRTFPVRRAAWVMALDADEFLNIHVGGGKLHDLIAAVPPEVDILALNFANFGNAPHLTWQSAPVCERFRYRLPLNHASNIPIKSLTRTPANFAAVHSHSMMRFRLARPIEVMRADGSRFSLPPETKLYERLRRFAPGEIAHGLAQINHHPIKTYDSFLLRRARGRGGVPISPDAPLRHSDTYFIDRAAAAERDDTVEKYRAATEALMAEMRAHPAVQRTEAACLATYRARLAKN